MTAQVVFVRVHEPDAVREIVKSALAIASELGTNDATRAPIFEKACDLLAARLPLQQMPTGAGFPIDLSQLRG